MRILIKIRWKKNLRRKNKNYSLQESKRKQERIEQKCEEHG